MEEQTRAAERPTGVELSTDRKLVVDWPTMITSLSNVAAQGFATTFHVTDGISNAISALLTAASSIRLESSPGEKAYQVVSLCFTWALDQVIPHGGKGPDRRNLAKEVVSAVTLSLKENPVMPSSFLERPTTLPLYISLRDEFVSRLSADVEQRPALSARFDAAFNRAVFELWSKRAEVLQPLLAALDAPGRDASEFVREWQAYRSSLISEFEVRPIFGQEQTKTPLSALYVPLRCGWSDISDDNEDGNEHTGQTNPQSKPKINLGMLEESLREWIENPLEDDLLRLVGGGPGSGKSTTMRAFARYLADIPNIRPLFIPLQHISLDGDLRDAINNYFSARTGSAFTQPPLSREAVEDGPPLLLIFDGLDELSRPGDAANDVAQLFVSKLYQMLPLLNGDQSKLTRVIATGRMPSFQAVRRQTGCRGHKSLEVLGYLPVTEFTIIKENRALSSVDQRPAWWAKYAVVSAQNAADAIPQALSDVRLASITHEPLLCYLLALSGFAIENWEAAAENRNRIYRRLVDAVWERGWGEGGSSSKRQGPGKTLSKNNFNHLMDTIGLAAWLGGDARVASEDGFREAVEITSAGSAWDEFQRDNGPDVTNLAMNFYLKSSEVEQRGFEFTHKSFGEYLCARALLRVAKETGQFIDRRVDVAMGDWLRSTRSGLLTIEVLTFMRDEVRLKNTEGSAGYAEGILKTFEKVVTAALAEGFPAQGNTSKSWRIAEGNQRNAEMMAWAVLNSCLVTMNGQSNSAIRRADIKWPSRKGSPRELISRATALDLNSPFLKCLSYVEFKGAEMFGLVLTNAELRGCDFTGTNLNGAHLMKSDLRGAIFNSARMERVHLDGASMSGAEIQDTNMQDARLGGAFDLDSATGVPSVTARTFLDVRKNIPDVSPIKRAKPGGLIKGEETLMQQAERAEKIFVAVTQTWGRKGSPKKRSASGGNKAQKG